MSGPFGSRVLDLFCRIMQPFILLFGLYILFHGHDTPGGGFQGGVILAASAILMRMIWGGREPWGLSFRAAVVLTCSGMFLYAAVGATALLFGGNFLDYGAIPLSSIAAENRFWGILGIEVGVAIAATGFPIVIYDSLSGTS